MRREDAEPIQVFLSPACSKAVHVGVQRGGVDRNYPKQYSPPFEGECYMKRLDIGSCAVYFSGNGYMHQMGRSVSRVYHQMVWGHPDCLDKWGRLGERVIRHTFFSRLSGQTYWMSLGIARDFVGDENISYDKVSRCSMYNSSLLITMLPVIKNDTSYTPNCMSCIILHILSYSAKK